VRDAVSALPPLSCLITSYDERLRFRNVYEPIRHDTGLTANDKLATHRAGLSTGTGADACVSVGGPQVTVDACDAPLARWQLIGSLHALESPLSVVKRGRICGQRSPPKQCLLCESRHS